MLTSMFAMAEARADRIEGGGEGSARRRSRRRRDDRARRRRSGARDVPEGLELYQSAQLDRAAMQFQNSMQMAPTFAPSRLFLGASLAEGNRHKEAGGAAAERVDQRRRTRRSRASPARNGSRRASRRWRSRRSSSPVQQPTPTRTRRSCWASPTCWAAGRPTRSPVLTPYLDANPTDTAALLAAIFGTYIRHLSAAAAGDAGRRSRRTWRSGRRPTRRTKGPMQPLVARGSSMCRS